jgi:hypothetical protein
VLSLRTKLLFHRETEGEYLNRMSRQNSLSMLSLCLSLSSVRLYVSFFLSRSSPCSLIRAPPPLTPSLSLFLPMSLRPEASFLPPTSSTVLDVPGGAQVGMPICSIFAVLLNCSKHCSKQGCVQVGHWRKRKSHCVQVGQKHWCWITKKRKRGNRDIFSAYKTVDTMVNSQYANLQLGLVSQKHL